MGKAWGRCAPNLRRDMFWSLDRFTHHYLGHGGGRRATNREGPPAFVHRVSVVERVNLRASHPCPDQRRPRVSKTPADAAARAGMAAAGCGDRSPRGNVPKRPAAFRCNGRRPRLFQTNGMVAHLITSLRLPVSVAIRTGEGLPIFCLTWLFFSRDPGPNRNSCQGIVSTRGKSARYCLRLAASRAAAIEKTTDGSKQAARSHPTMPPADDQTQPVARNPRRIARP